MSTGSPVGKPAGTGHLAARVVIVGAIAGDRGETSVRLAGACRYNSGSMRHTSRRTALAGWIVVGFTLAGMPAWGQNLAAGGAAGTLGLGVQVEASWTRHLAGRVGLFAGRLGRDFEASGIDYDGTLELAHLGAMLDFHPAASGFRLTAGVVYNDTELSGRAPLDQLLDRVDPGEIPPGIEIPEDLGRLEARLTGERFAPYAGLGFSHRPGARGWSFTFDLGAYYQGAPKASSELSTPLPIDTVPGLRELIDDLLAEHEADLEEEVRDYRFFPVLMLGVSYRF